MSVLDDKLKAAGRVAITGHVNPDGDCYGSCLGLFNYIKAAYPQVQATVFLELAPVRFAFLAGAAEISTVYPDDECFDLCICLDCGDEKRLGGGGRLLANARDSLCIDHHVTNAGYAKTNVVAAHLSSTCELLFTLMDEQTALRREIAECLYTGIIHDTGVLKYPSTTMQTMNIAGKLMNTGIDFTRIIDDTFFKKSYVQNQILGRALLESVLFMEGKCIFTAITMKEMEFYGITGKDLEGVAEALRVTDGVECAILTYETECQKYKVSLRSNRYVDVAKVAAFFGGGGHVRAAGCSINGNVHDVINNLAGQIQQQMQ